MPRRSIAIVVLCLTLPFAMAWQDDGAGQTTGQQGSDEPAWESIVTETHRTVWTLEVTAILSRFEFTDAQNDAVAEAFVEARTKHLDSQDYYRDEQRALREEMIERSRRTGGVGADFFDQSELRRQLEADTAHKRKLLARDLVRILRTDTAQEIYPYLGGFDSKYDALVKEIIGFELEDEPTTQNATLAIMDYQLALNQAREEAGLDRAKFGQMRVEIRDAFIKSIDPYLDDEQTSRIAKLVGAARR